MLTVALLAFCQPANAAAPSLWETSVIKDGIVEIDSLAERLDTLDEPSYDAKTGVLTVQLVTFATADASTAFAKEFAKQESLTPQPITEVLTWTLKITEDDLGNLDDARDGLIDPATHRVGSLDGVVDLLSARSRIGDTPASSYLSRLKIDVDAGPESTGYNSLMVEARISERSAMMMTDDEAKRYYEAGKQFASGAKTFSASVSTGNVVGAIYGLAEMYGAVDGAMHPGESMSGGTAVIVGAVVATATWLGEVWDDATSDDEDDSSPSESSDESGSTTTTPSLDFESSSAKELVAALALAERLGLQPGPDRVADARTDCKLYDCSKVEAPLVFRTQVSLTTVGCDDGVSHCIGDNTKKVAGQMIEIDTQCLVDGCDEGGWSGVNFSNTVANMEDKDLSMKGGELSANVDLDAISEAVVGW